MVIKYENFFLRGYIDLIYLKRFSVLEGNNILKLNVNVSVILFNMVFSVPTSITIAVRLFIMFKLYLTYSKHFNNKYIIVVTIAALVTNHTLTSVWKTLEKI